MQSECSECDRVAVSYWGCSAYCKVHLSVVMNITPSLHRCVRCGEVQPANVAWFRTHPCSKCQGQ